MSNIIQFTQAQVPAHLRTTAAAKAVADLTQGVTASYPVISIKGKTWAIVKSKERTVIVDTEREPVRSIKVVIVKGNPQVSKVFYAGGYTEGSDDKPTCYSNDGIAPAADVEEKQSAKCATCPHNAWGSAVSAETGVATKGKACADSRRLAVMPADLKGDPMLLRVPPASLKNVADYGRALAEKNVPYNGVVTKMSFDPDAASPKLVLKFESFLTEEAYSKVQEIAEGDLVDAIIARGPVPMEDTAGSNSAANQESFDAHDRAAAAAPAPAPAAAAPKPRARKPAAAPAPAPVEPDEVEDAGASLGGFGGDDAPADPPAATKPKASPQPASAAPATAAVAGDDDLEAELANALAGFDD